MTEGTQSSYDSRNPRCCTFFVQGRLPICFLQKQQSAAASGTAEKTEIVLKAEEDSFERNDQSKEQKSIYAEFVEEERKKAMEEQKQDPSEFEYVKLEEEEE